MDVNLCFIGWPTDLREVGMADLAGSGVSWRILPSSKCCHPECQSRLLVVNFRIIESLTKELTFRMTKTSPANNCA